jgi:uridine phosphorylase
VHAYVNHCKRKVQDNTIMYVKLKGPGHIEIRTERVIQVSMTLAMSTDEFYNTQERPCPCPAGSNRKHICPAQLA